jgi:hypothetical protein
MPKEAISSAEQKIERVQESPADYSTLPTHELGGPYKPTLHRPSVARSVLTSSGYRTSKQLKLEMTRWLIEEKARQLAI